MEVFGILGIRAQILLPLGRCVLGMSGNKAESLIVPRRAGLRAALHLPGRLGGLAIWISRPRAPAAQMLAVCMVLLLSGESWAKSLDAF